MTVCILKGDMVGLDLTSKHTRSSAYAVYIKHGVGTNVDQTRTFNHTIIAVYSMLFTCILLSLLSVHDSAILQDWAGVLS